MKQRPRDHLIDVCFLIAGTLGNVCALGVVVLVAMVKL
jgi:hypothetical protein